MGTHPIFESDFDCLTDSTGLIKIKMARNSTTAGGIMKHSRSKMYSRRAQHKRTKTVTKQEKKAASAVTEKQVGGAKNGGSRKVVAVRQPKYYPTLSIRRKVQGHGQKPFSQHARSLRSNIKPGTVLIMLAGAARGKRVVFLKQLASGLLLVTGPFKVNGVPMRRCTASAVIATSTSVDVSAMNIPDHVDDAYFKRAAQPKKTEEGIFESNAEAYTASEVRKNDQKAVDAGILGALAADKFLKGYLKSEFGLSRGQYPHNMKF